MIRFIFLLFIAITVIGSLSYFLIFSPTNQNTASGWYDSNWNYRVPVAVNNSNNANVLANYQINVTLSSSNFNFSKALPDGSDIRVTDSDGKTLIPYYIENFDSTQKTGNIWVKVPNIPASSSSNIYVYYGNSSPSTFDVPPIGPFQKYGTKPIVTASGSGVLPEDIVFDDSTNKYWMLISDRQTNNYRLSLYYSTDLATWSNYSSNPILTSSVNLDAPHLLKYNNTWYLYYEENHDIQLATSSKVTGPYTKHPKSPMVKKGPGAWEAGRVTEMYVFKRDDGTWMMFYMGDTGAQIEQVGYATAPAPEGPWIKYANNPAIPFGAAGTYDAGTVADPFVYKFGDTYYIFYASSASKSFPWEEAYVTTKDFVNFTRGNIVVGRGSQPSFDDYNAHRGALIRVGDYYYMSYAGYGGDNPYRLYQAGMAKQYAKSNAKGFPPEQVFDLYDNFSTNTLSSQLRTERNANGNGTASISNGILTLRSGTNSTIRPFLKLFSVQEFGPGYILETRVQHPNANGTSNFASSIGFGDGNFNPANSDFWTAGKFNNGGSFINKDLDVNLGNKSSLSITKNMTVDTWIKVNNYTSQVENYFVSKNPGWAFYIGSDGGLKILYNGGTTVSAAGAFTSNDIGKWVHVAFTYNGSTTKIYKNGVSLATSGGFSGDMNTTATLFAGERGDKEWYFNGTLDEIRISNIVRYTGNFTPPTNEYTPDANTVGLWHFNETGGSVFDATPNQNNGYITGGRGVNIHQFNTPTWMRAASNGVGTENAMAQNIDTNYHTQRVWFKSKTEVDFQNDSNPWEPLTAHIPSGTLPVSFIINATNYYPFTNNGQLNIDWIKVRKFTDNEPTLSLGDEENSIPPIISAINASATANGATITWATDKYSSSIVDYGTDDSYGNSSPETDTSPGVTSHSVTLSNLNSCTTYHYRVKSNYLTASQGKSDDQTFATTNCVVPTPSPTPVMVTPPPSPQALSVPQLIDIKSSTDAIVVNNFPLFKNSSQFTLSAWVNFTPKTPERYIAWANGVDFRVGYQRVAFGLYRKYGFGVLRFTPGDLDGGKWRFVAFTFNGTQQKIYLDGNLLGSEQAYGKTDKMISDKLIIGKTDSSDTYSGSISKLSTYNVALTDSQIKQLYAAGH